MEQREEPLAWLYELSTQQLAEVMADPGAILADQTARLLQDEYEYALQSFPPGMLEGDDEWRYQLDPEEADALLDLRENLDEWWENLPAETRRALRKHQAGMVEGQYREDVLPVVPNAAGRGGDLRRPFQLPHVILAYVKIAD